METIVDELIGIISKEIEAFEKLLDTLREKQRAIVEGAIERLNQTVQDENTIANRTKVLEAERIVRTKELAEKLEMDELNPKLSTIIERVEKKYAQRLTEQRNLLRSVVQNIQNLNKSNQYLLNYSLDYIEKSMQILLGGTEPSNIYQRDGKVKESPRKNKILDHSI